MPGNLGGDTHKQRLEGASKDRTFQQRRVERASKVNEQPWGRFLLGILIRVGVVFAVAATVITVIELLRG